LSFSRKKTKQLGLLYEILQPYAKFKEEKTTFEEFEKENEHELNYAWFNFTSLCQGLDFLLSYKNPWIIFYICFSDFFNSQVNY
jgi:hypothetical protein